MADVKLTMEADVAQVIRTNDALAASEDRQAAAFRRKADAAEQANRRVENSAKQTAAAVREYDLAPTGGVPMASPAVRVMAGSSPLNRTRAYGLAPMSSGNLASAGITVATASAGYEMATDVRKRELDIKAASARERTDTIVANASKRAADQEELQRRLDANRLEQMVGDYRKKQESVRAVTAGVVAGAAAFAVALASAATAIIQQMEKDRDKIDSFHKAGSGATSLPAYMKDSVGFKKMAVGLSNNYNADVNEVVSPLLEQIAVQGPNLSADERKQMAEMSLRFEQMTGQSAKGVAGVVDNIRDVYPKMSIKEAGNLVGHLRDQGGLTVANQEQVLGTLLPQMERLGIKPEEMAAIASMTSQVGGPEGAMAKGARAALMKLEGLKKKKLISGTGGLMGSFKELDALATRRPDVISDTFSELGVNAAPMLKYVATHEDDYNKSLVAAKAAMAGSGEEGKYQAKLASDPEFALYTRSGRAKRTADNAKLLTELQEQSRQVNYEEHKASLQTGLVIRDGDSATTVGAKKLIGAAGPTLSSVPLVGGIAGGMVETGLPYAYASQQIDPGAGMIGGRNGQIIGPPAGTPRLSAQSAGADRFGAAVDKLDRILTGHEIRANSSVLRRPATQPTSGGVIGVQ